MSLMSNIAVVLALVISISVVSTLLFIVYFRLYFQTLRCSQKRSLEKKIAFFHPYCSSGGGGERVLWKTIQVLDELHAKGLRFEVVVYTIDAASERYPENLFQQVKTRFAIEPPTSLKVSFAHLDKFSHCFDKATSFSLVAESWGTMRFAYNALLASTPDIYFDTTGCAFTYIVARILAGCNVVAYVHYPTISMDMLQLVWDRRPSYNNDSRVAKSSIITYVKLVYYSLFACAYAFVGSLCCLVMVNSTWTQEHIASLWRGAAGRIHVVFPPCDTESLKNLPLDRLRPIIVSIGQFRPEKDHTLQIRSFELLRKKYPKWDAAKLVLIGSCRGKDDEKRVQELHGLVSSLALDDSVDFVLNQPYPVIKRGLAKASVGLHTMWNEHFGIGVVEMMAAGLLVIAHNSGGPKRDIVVQYEGKQTGFLAVTETEFADAMNEALSLDVAQSRNTRLLARQSTARFSDEAFNLSFKKVILESGLLTN